MAALGYNSELGAEQPLPVATNMRWLVAGLYAFCGIVMFISIALIYNLDKKTVAQMTEELNERRGINAEETVDTNAEIDSAEVETEEEVCECDCACEEETEE